MYKAKWVTAQFLLADWTLANKSDTAIWNIYTAFCFCRPISWWSGTGCINQGIHWCVCVCVAFHTRPSLLWVCVKISLYIAFERLRKRKWTQIAKSYANANGHKSQKATQTDTNRKKQRKRRPQPCLWNQILFVSSTAIMPITANVSQRH